jgi:hypothetical protein
MVFCSEDVAATGNGTTDEHRFTRIKRKMNRRWTQMNIDVKRVKGNWTISLRLSAPINKTL